MLLGANQDLENRIALVLAEKGKLFAEEIQKELKQNKNPATVQGVYRVLRKLQAEGVVVKEKQKYSLRIPWLLDIGALVSRTEQVYLQASYINALLPAKSGQKHTWRFTDLLKLNDFWSQVLLSMAKVSKGSIMIDYDPHAWFHLVQPAQEQQYTRTLLKVLKKEYAIIGGVSYLDKWIAQQYWQVKGFEYFLASAKHWPEKDRGKYVAVIDDLVLTVKLDPGTTQIIDKLFQSVKVISALKTEKVLEIFSRRARARMIVENNKKKANEYRKKFEKIFGPLKV